MFLGSFVICKQGTVTWFLGSDWLRSLESCIAEEARQTALSNVTSRNTLAAKWALLQDYLFTGTTWYTSTRRDGFFCRLLCDSNALRCALQVVRFYMICMYKGILNVYCKHFKNRHLTSYFLMHGYILKYQEFCSLTANLQQLHGAKYLPSTAW